MEKTKEQLALEYPQLQADIDLCYKYLFAICHGERLCLSVPPRKDNYDMQISAALDELEAHRSIGTPEELAGLVEKKKAGLLVELPPLGEEDYPGLKVKYRVFKAKNGEPVENCFVLRPDKDDAAWYALMEHASHTKNKQLAADIRAWCDHLTGIQIESIRNAEAALAGKEGE